MENTTTAVDDGDSSSDNMDEGYKDRAREAGKNEIDNDDDKSNGDDDSSSDNMDEGYKHRAREAGKNESDNDDDKSNGDDDSSEQSEKDSSSSDDEDSSSSDSDDDGNDDDDRTTEHEGQELSEYELLRLERIRRNREYLSQLGLEGKDGGGILGTKKPAGRKRNKKSDTEAPMEKRSSSRSRKSINYAEPPTSVASLLQQANPEKKKEEKKTPKPRAPRSGGKSHRHRMERFIYDQFQKIKTKKKRTLIEAERQVRHAEKEVAYWKKRTEVWDRQEERRREVERIRKAQEEERADLGGTIKELLQDIDRRMPELLSAATQYDDVFQAACREREKETKRLEAEGKMKLLEALERFPKAMKTSTSLLNSVLLERAPKDPPPPRRSKRAAEDEKHDTPATPKQDKTARRNTTSDKCDMGTEGWDQNEPIMSSPAEEDRVETSPPRDQQQQGSKRKRCARNVGGWLSPNLSEVIDRSWIEKDSPVDKFNPSTYVPQVGDTVLYYPEGHRAYLDKYPDVLGKKTRSVSRVPLWERAASEKENQSSDGGGKQSDADPWWNDEWLAGIESDLGRYPIVCRVERTHAEFPPDPFSKILKKDDGGNVVKVYWKAPKDPGAMKRIAGTPLRLAIGLRPLTPLMPPSWTDSGPRDDHKLSLPPSFTVVSFPCELRPFIAPFAWAYAASHSFTANEMVSSLSKSGAGKLRVCEIAMLRESHGSMRLHDKVPFLRSLVQRWDSAAPYQTELANDLSKYPQKFPLQDARCVISVLKSFLGDDGNAEEHGRQDGVIPINIVDFIRSTIPLWGSVNAVPKVYNGKRLHFSPWELVPQRKTSYHPVAFHLDDGLRDKVEFAIENLIAEDQSADLFRYPVTEEDAPSYSCAVPLGMSISKILERLNGGKGTRRSYYRGIDSLLADIAAILDNCLLYNSPDSPVVEAGVDLVSRLKESISKVAQTHFRELADARKVDEERRQHVLRQFEGPTEGHVMEEREDFKHTVISTLKTPYKDPLDRKWLIQRMGTNDQRENAWVPQAGEEILYSRESHELFVKAHYPSLEAHQCAVLSGDRSGGDSEASASDWIQGKVLWTRPAFPKCLSKKSNEDAATFKTSALLLAIGVKLTQSSTSGVIYWRPCIMEADHEHDTEPTCNCGLSQLESFIRPLGSSQPETDINDDQTSVTRTGGLPGQSRLEAIDLLFSFLKKRCLREIPPSALEPELTKASVKQGYKPSSARGGLRNLPNYHHILVSEESSPSSTGAMVTRGIPRKTLVDDAGRDRLSDCGFLPPWLRGIGEESKELSLCETVLPLPQLSIELVQIRLRNGYYCHVAAIENDLIESFVTTAVLCIRESVSRKKSPMSMKRVVRAMASNGNSNALEDASVGAPQEENQLADHLRFVRDLYATALVATSNTEHLTRLFGLAQPVERSLQSVAVSDPEQDPDRATARQKLAYLLAAVGRDNLQNTFTSKSVTSDKLPTLGVTVKCNGETVTHTKEVRRVDHTIAELKGKEVKVKFTCGGKEVYIDRPVDPGDVHRSVGSAGGDIRQVRVSSIKIKPSEYEASDDIVRFFFGRPGRMDPCARCKAYGRSLLVCRVRRAHSNMDLDWISAFKGVGGVDGLLRALHPDGMSSSPSTVDDSSHENKASNEESPSQDQKESDHQGTDEDNGGPDDPAQPKSQTDEVDILDPRAFLAKADEALALARTLHRDAKKFSEEPARLGKHFVKNNFPIDPSDGHYVYCVVCGISGDLICCDGCPNVLHSRCIGVAQVPDGEWFCEECELEGKTSRESAKESPATEPKADDSAEASVLPFGRNVFNEDKSKELVAAIQHLRDSRPERQRRNEATVPDDDPQADDSDESSDDDSFVSSYATKKRRRHANTVIDSTNGQPVPKRPRGRPRKNAEPIHQAARSASGGQSITKRPRGRPRKIQELAQRDPSPVAKRPRGRSRKSGLLDKPTGSLDTSIATKKRKGTQHLQSKPDKPHSKRLRGRPKIPADEDDKSDDTGKVRARKPILKNSPPRTLAQGGRNARAERQRQSADEDGVRSGGNRRVKKSPKRRNGAQFGAAVERQNHRQEPRVERVSYVEDLTILADDDSPSMIEPQPKTPKRKKTSDSVSEQVASTSRSGRKSRPPDFFANHL